MGSCTSIHRDPNSITGFGFCIGSKAKQLSKEAKALNGKHPIVEFDYNGKPVESVFGVRSRELGSREDIFFDSQACLDSDCEDDYFSVNGDFTPSRGSTPNYQTRSQATPQLNIAHLTSNSVTKSELSPTDGKMKFADLLHGNSLVEPTRCQQNSVRFEVDSNGKPDLDKLVADQPPRTPSDGTTHFSGANSICSGEATPNEDGKLRNEKTGKISHCCMPGLIDLNGRRKQKMSPENTEHADKA